MTTPQTIRGQVRETRGNVATGSPTRPSVAWPQRGQSILNCSTMGGMPTRTRFRRQPEWEAGLPDLPIAVTVADRAGSAVRLRGHRGRPSLTQIVRDALGRRELASNCLVSPPGSRSQYSCRSALVTMPRMWLAPFRCHRARRPCRSSLCRRRAGNPLPQESASRQKGQGRKRVNGDPQRRSSGAVSTEAALKVSLRQAPIPFIHRVTLAHCRKLGRLRGTVAACSYFVLSDSRSKTCKPAVVTIGLPMPVPLLARPVRAGFSQSGGRFHRGRDRPFSVCLSPTGGDLLGAGGGDSMVLAPFRRGPRGGRPLDSTAKRWTSSWSTSTASAPSRSGAARVIG